MALYNSRGNYNVTTDSGRGLLSADGELRITIVPGTSYTGLYAADGSWNVVVVQKNDLPISLYHPCGALRVCEATTETGTQAPNGATYVSGASYSILMAGSETDVLTMASIDDTMTIRSTSDTNDNYQGTPGAKLTTTRASSATYWDSNGILQSAGNNTLRRDYDPRLSSTTERCGYLIEEARTNLALRSEAFDNATWTSSSLTITPDTTIAPDGTLTADTATTSNSSNNLRQQITVTASTNYVFSFFALKGTLLDVKYSVFNVTGAANIIAPTSYNSLINASTWVRVEVPFTTPVGCTSVYIYPVRDTGVGNGTIILWGAQLEAGSFASSYIPTAGSTVTRAADLVTLAGTLFPLNQTEGTLYAKFAGPYANGSILAVSDGTTNERHQYQISSGGNHRALSSDGGVSQVDIFGGAATGFTGAKGAYGYKLNDCAAALGGQTVQSDNVCTMPTTTTMYFGASAAGAFQLNGWLFEAAYFPTRKTNSQLQALASGYASDALLLMGAETQGLTFSASDQSMSILDTGTPANAYSGELSDKLGSIRTSNAMRYNASGLLELVTNGSLRLDYDSRLTGGPGYLVEEARTNLGLRSQEFDNATWIKVRCTISANSQAAPDGTTTADTLAEDASNNSHPMLQTVAGFVSGTTYAITIFAKAANRSQVAVALSTSAFTGAQGGNFDLSAVTAAATGTAVSASIQSVGNGWYRLTVIATADVTGSADIYYQPRLAGSTSYQGTSVDSIYFWGFQAEAGAFATSYIPTTTASVTRAADIPVMLTSALPFSATAGTFVGRFSTILGGTNPTTLALLAFDDGSSAESITMFVDNSAGLGLFQVIDGGVSQATPNQALGKVSGTVYGMAAGWAANDFATSINGGTIQTDASGTLPTVTKLNFGGRATGVQLNGWLRHGRYFPTRKSNADLVTLAAAA